jgi:hypothetical protein
VKEAVWPPWPQLSCRVTRSSLVEKGSAIRRYLLKVGMFALVLVLAAGWAGTAVSDERTGMGDDLSEWGELAPIRDKTGVSLAPIFAYEPTFGTVWGGAIFLDRPTDPRYWMYARLAFSTDEEYSAEFKVKRWMDNDAYYDLHLELDDFDRPYYGEGMDTDASESILIEGTVLKVKYFLKFRKSGKLTYGPFIDYRGASFDGVDGTDIAPPEYDERSLGAGLCVFYDARDSSLNPTKGVYDTLTLRVVPDGLSTYELSGSFFQAEVDHRIFHSPAPGLVLAGRLALAGTWGRPSYQYRYELGGPYALRGYFINRFRGDSYYVLQGEARKELFWIFSGALFAEAGAVTDDRFGGPEYSAGAGLRMTLPPDHVAKARLDFAWSEDQHSVYFLFGEAF